MVQTKERKEFIHYSDSQKSQARETDIIEFLNHYEGFTFKHAGSGYKCDQHNSLVVNKDRKMWFWNSQNQKGVTVIDYLQDIHGKSYLEAMGIIIGKGEDKPHIPIAPKIVEPEIKELQLPKKAEGRYSRVFAYLTQGRGIDKDIVTKCMKDKVIYQDKNNNVVFVGLDENNVAKFGCVRGTLSEVQYRGDCKGSDKTYSFNIKGTSPERLYVYESPIDLLSYITMSKLNSTSDVWKNHNYISLSGTTDVALESYLERNKNVTSIIFCLDNDEAGISASESYIKKYAEKGYNALRKSPKGKDFNDDLVKSFSVKPKEGEAVIITYSHSLSR